MWLKQGPLSTGMSTFIGALRKYLCLLPSTAVPSRLNVHCPVQRIPTMFEQNSMLFPKILLKSRSLTTVSRPAFTCSPCYSQIHIPVASTEGFLPVVFQVNYRLIIFPLNPVIPVVLEKNSLKFPTSPLLSMLVLHTHHHF